MKLQARKKRQPKIDTAIEKASGKGRRHELSWNLFLIWQLLRRSKKYQKAIDSFNELIESKNEETLSTSMQIILERLIEVTINDTYKAESTKDLENLLNNLDYEEQSLHLTDISFSLLKCSELKEFNEEFGNIILFPLHYAIEKPKLSVLRDILILRPSVLIPEVAFLKDHMIFKNNTIEYEFPENFSKKITFTLMIDTQFSDNAIIMESTAAIKNFLEKLRRIPNNPFLDSEHKISELSQKRVKWNEFIEYFPIWDMHNDGYSYNKIAKNLFPNLDIETSKSKIKQRIETINHFIHLLEKSALK